HVRTRRARLSWPRARPRARQDRAALTARLSPDPLARPCRDALSPARRSLSWRPPRSGDRRRSLDAVDRPRCPARSPPYRRVPREPGMGAVRGGGPLAAKAPCRRASAITAANGRPLRLLAGWRRRGAAVRRSTTSWEVTQ